MAIVILFLTTKLLGKRQVSQLSMFEYITGITIGNIAGYISLDLDTYWYLGLISIGVWVTVSFGIELLQLKSKRARDFIDGKGTVLIRNGVVLEQNLKKERLTSDELLEQLRKKSAFSFADVEFAIMEPSGDLNVLMNEQNRPVTAEMLGMTVPDEPTPEAVIMDGVVMDDALQARGLNREWLYRKLSEMKLAVREIYLAQVGSAEELDVDLYESDTKTK
ncbi:MAG: rane protein [Paenibacillaceae bacterium]|nr:rane protein [Paenibacillaceae bacterium]